MKTTFLYFEELCLYVLLGTDSTQFFHTYLQTTRLEMSSFATRQQVFDFSLLTYLKVTVLRFQHARPWLCHIFALSCHTHRIKKMWYTTTPPPKQTFEDSYLWFQTSSVFFSLFFLASWYRGEWLTAPDAVTTLWSPNGVSAEVSKTYNRRATEVKGWGWGWEGGAEWKRELEWLGRSQGQRKGTEVHF